jgi:prophage DNA circulation protein
MSDWKTRLKEYIWFQSPDWNEFYAKWKGDTRELEKMIGEFSFPGRDGSIVQDLGSRGARYPLTIYFDGPDHDLIASAFFEAIKEKGVWFVEHPVYGFIELQPIRITETAAPVESGNVTEIVTEWIEPLDEITLETARQMWGTIDKLQDDLKAASAETFSDQVVTGEED